jgi:hypothetical protein
MFPMDTSWFELRLQLLLKYRLESAVGTVVEEESSTIMATSIAPITSTAAIFAQPSITDGS